jgi:hypothetical protein
MEFISALALVVSVIKVIIMWLNYRDCKKSRNALSQKNTD